MASLGFVSNAKLGAAGWSSPVARQAHNLKVVGSNPTPATSTTPILTIKSRAEISNVGQSRNALAVSVILHAAGSK